MKKTLCRCTWTEGSNLDDPLDVLNLKSESETETESELEEPKQNPKNIAKHLQINQHLTPPTFEAHTALMKC